MASRPRSSIELPRVAFIALMAFWLLYPLAEQGKPAQDAIPLVTAADLVDSHPGAIYVGPNGGLFKTKPDFFRQSCTYYDNPADCDRLVVAFVSPPLAMPLVIPLSALGEGAFPLARELGALALVGAMVIIWRRLTGRTAAAAWPLAIAAILLTPLMTTPIGLGQSSPFLFLVAALPISLMAKDYRRAAVFGALFSVVAALKAFPLALLALPAWQRRWRAVISAVVAVAVLAIAALVVAPSSLWHDFLVSSVPLSREALDNPYSSSLESALGQVGVHSAALAWMLRAALSVPIVSVVRRMDVDGQWAGAWAATLVLFPQVWGHYSFLLIAAIGAVLVGRADRDRWLWALPAVAAATVPIGVLGGSGHGSPAVQLAANVAGLAIVLGIARAPMPAPAAGGAT